jgi:hypothetical protein
MKTPFILMLVLTALTGLPAQTANPGLPVEPWFTRALVGMEVGPTGAQWGHSDTNDSRYCARFDGREIVRHAVAAHSQYLVLWVRDGDYAYYDSKLLPKAPGLGARDPLREALEEARPHKLPIIAYCVVQQGGHFLKAHPEWEMRGADGKPIGRFCYNSGYLEAMKQIVAEQLAYGIDGFHIDMVDQGFGPPYGCWCDACRSLFDKEFGQPMPKGVAWDDAWDRMLEFRYRSSERFEQALYRHIKSINPRATVDYNYHGNPPFSFEVGQRPVQHAGNGDFITGETGVWGFSALTVGLNVEFYRAAVPHQRVQVAMQRGVRMYHDQTTRPLNDIRWELLTLLAHGSFVTVVDKTGFDGWLDPVTYDRLGAAFHEARAKRAHFGHRPVAEVGIFFSSRARDWVGRAKPADHFGSFQGAHKALVYEHIPYGVLLEENLTLDSLQRFPVVLLPNVAIVSDTEVELFRRYVEKGGRLLITGLSGTRGWRGQTNAHSTLEGLVGATLVRTLDSTDNWVRLTTPPSAELESLSVGIPHARRVKQAADAVETVPFLVRGPAVVYKPTTATSVGDLLKPHRTKQHEEGRYAEDWPLSAEAPVGPAILLHRLGQGRVLSLAASPDWATASDHHIVEARKLLANAVRLLHPQPRLRISAPSTVEAVVTDDPEARTLRVHFLGYNSPPQTTPAKDRPYILPGLIEDVPIYRAIIEVRDGLKSAKALNRSTELKRRGNRVELTVEDIHEVLQCRY